MAFWSSLVFSETRVGGLRERSQQFFEAGAARFPEDYPGTTAFDEYELRREADDKGYHDRRPPAKRPNYAKLGTTSPFRAEMREIVVLRWPERDVMIPLWIVPFSVARIVEERLSAGALVAKTAGEIMAVRLIDGWRDTTFADDEVWTPAPDTSMLREALVRVKVTPCGRGAPEELGVIYWMTDPRWEEVRGKVATAGKGQARARARATGEGEGAEDVGSFFLFLYWLMGASLMLVVLAALLPA